MNQNADETTRENPETETPEAGTLGGISDSETTQPEAQPQPDSANFLRCSDCTHAEGVDASAGALFCRKHNMHINAEADEIPDDCVEFEARSGDGSPVLQ